MPVAQVQLSTRAHQENQCHKLNLSLFFSCSIQNPARVLFFKREADWMIYLTFVVRGQLGPVQALRSRIRDPMWKISQKF